MIVAIKQCKNFSTKGAYGIARICQDAKILRKIDFVMEKRLPDPNAEWDRLFQNQKIVSRVQTVETRSKICDFMANINLAQSFELQESLKDSHYVINHAQTNKGSVINIVASTLQAKNSNNKPKYFECLRDSYFLEKIPEETTVATLQKMVSYDKNDHHFRNELISGDINLTSTEGAESANYFHRHKYNIAENHIFGFVQKRLTEILSYHLGEAIGEKTAETIHEVTKSLSGSTLYSICIPKERFSSMGYFSYEYGISAQQKDIPSEPEIEAGQEGTHASAIQVRLFTKELRAENGVFIIPHSDLGSQKRKEIEEKVQEIINAYAIERKLLSHCNFYRNFFLDS